MVNTVLIAGDDPLIVDLLSQLLTLSGFDVITTSDESDLPLHPAPVLLLMDLDPVTIEGYRRLRRLREGFQSGVPTIGFTSADDPHELAREFDVSLLFSKPFDIDRVLQAVRWLLVPSIDRDRASALTPFTQTVFVRAAR